jgi:hypothetical protein
MAHPTLAEVRRIARYLRRRDLTAERAGEERMLRTILRGSPDPHTRARAEALLQTLRAPRGEGRPRHAEYQVANTRLRWWAICLRIRRWERVERIRFGRRRGSITAACRRVEDETGIA